MGEIVPGQEFPDALTAIRFGLADAESVSAAVAFVTRSGVDLIGKELAKLPEISLEVCARGAPVTEQEAVLDLSDNLKADVTLVMGTDSVRFHPKLWLFRSTTALTVVSGSGNLTRGGLVHNVEQFEVEQHLLDSAAAKAHERRYDELVSGALPLDEVRASPAWYEWKDQSPERARLANEQKKLDDKLASRKAGSRDADKQLLMDDLQSLYERTVAAKLPRADGQNYVPNRFRQGLENAKAANNPVPMVARICRRQTEGFDVILEHGGPEFTVEALVADTGKPYHDLFPEKTRLLAMERLKQFDGNA